MRPRLPTRPKPRHPIQRADGGCREPAAPVGHVGRKAASATTDVAHQRPAMSAASALPARLHPSAGALAPAAARFGCRPGLCDSAARNHESIAAEAGVACPQDGRGGGALEPARKARGVGCFARTRSPHKAKGQPAGRHLVYGCALRWRDSRPGGELKKTPRRVAQKRDRRVSGPGLRRGTERGLTALATPRPPCPVVAHKYFRACRAISQTAASTASSRM